MTDNFNQILEEALNLKQIVLNKFDENQQIEIDFINYESDFDEKNGYFISIHDSDLTEEQIEKIEQIINKKIKTSAFYIVKCTCSIFLEEKDQYYENLNQNSLCYCRICGIKKGMYGYGRIESKNDAIKLINLFANQKESLSCIELLKESYNIEDSELNISPLEINEKIREDLEVFFNDEYD
jgi:hypothetical protein